MKSLIFIAGLVFAVSATAEAEIKRVCKDKVDKAG